MIQFQVSGLLFDNDGVLVDSEPLSMREALGAPDPDADHKTAQAQLALIRAQLDRTRIIAPFDGLVVSGDLSQSVGTALRRGEELFRIAPLDDWRVVLRVDEEDIRDITAGQTGRLRLSARPEAPLAFEITQVTPVAQAEGGRNAFRVEARLADPPDWLRPAMEGVARVDIDERLIADIWTRRARIRLSLFLWGYTG